MLIGEASLKSAAFSPRLVMLLGDLRAAGCTVWLEGLRLRFDRPDAAPGPRTRRVIWPSSHGTPRGAEVSGSGPGRWVIAARLIGPPIGRGGPGGGGASCDP